MGKPVVASRPFAQALTANSDDLVCATGVTSFVHEIVALLQSPERASRLGQSARQRVIESYSWAAHLGGIDRYLSAQHPS